MSQNLFPRFNMDAATAKINLFSLSLHDHKMLSPTLARVVLSYTGHAPEAEELHSHIAKLFQGQATPVVGSFSALTRDGAIKSMIGFVKASREIVLFDDAVKASVDGKPKYKAMASNLLMDKTDNSMWEIRSGATGKYLAKQNHADMSELVHLATATVHGLPKFAQIASAPVQPKEFAQFVNLDTEEVANGFVVASTEDEIKVFCVESNAVVQLGYDQLIEVAELTPEEAKISGMEMAPEIAADQSDPSTLVEYYRKAYPYAPDYVAKIIDMISQHRYG